LHFRPNFDLHPSISQLLSPSFYLRSEIHAEFEELEEAVADDLKQIGLDFEIIFSLARDPDRFDRSPGHQMAGAGAGAAFADLDGINQRLETRD
jgi:hypothetical protein